jgi:NAD(P)H-hydrate epimerase
MTPPTITRDQARELDRRAVDEYHMPSALLMENAGRGTVDVLESLGIHGPVVVCAGAGNNGGDGFVIARRLDLRGYQVRVLLLADPARLTPDAALNYRILEASGISIERPPAGDLPDWLSVRLAGADWIVDALLGTGARGEPRPPLDAAIDAINAAGRKVLAVDLPSGLDCDTGQAARHTIRAAHTCTFVAPKPGFAAPGASQYVGQVHTVDIGAPRRLVEEILSG